VIHVFDDVEVNVGVFVFLAQRCVIKVIHNGDVEASTAGCHGPKAGSNLEHFAGQETVIE
jgi:hypothetical protein